MLTTPPTHDSRHRTTRRLWWYVALSRAALAFALGAMAVLSLGILCIPVGFFNPKLVGSLFAALRADGAFVTWVRPLFEVAGLLGALAVSLLVLVRVVFRVKHE